MRKLNETGGFAVALFFTSHQTKIPADLPKMCRSQKFGSTGPRVRGVGGVNGVFVPSKLTALKMACMGLVGQNSFHTGFTRLKLVSILQFSDAYEPLEITPRFC